jgi:ACS family tartrate transporter-like MFS transporter
MAIGSIIWRLEDVSRRRMRVNDVAAQTTARVLRRVSWFLAMILFVNTLDRVNVSFASLAMNQELGLDPRQYGLGVSLFFVSYIGLQLPAMALAERLGLVRAIGAMAIAWGVVSTAMSLMQGPMSYYVLRLLLGAMEAGVSPAIILYISRWAPAAVTARFVGLTALALPASFIFGAPVSGLIMTELNGAIGLSGWRWMYLVEGLLPVGLGLMTFFWLQEDASRAHWLRPDQRRWLVAQLRSEAASSDTVADTGFLARVRLVLRDRRTWALGAIMFCTSMGFYGFLYWLPQVVRMLTSSSNMVVLILSALPWLSAGTGMIVFGRSSDRRKERHFHVGIAALLAAVAMTFAALLTQPALSFVALVIAGVGVGAAQGVFYSIPISTMRGMPQMGLALAFISILGNAAGLVGASVIGTLVTVTSSFTSSIIMMAAFYLAAAITVIAIRPREGPKPGTPETR